MPYIAGFFLWDKFSGITISGITEKIFAGLIFMASKLCSLNTLIAAQTAAGWTKEESGPSGFGSCPCGIA